MSTPSKLYCLNQAISELMKTERVEAEEAILEYGPLVADHPPIARSVLRLGFVLFNALTCEYLKAKVSKHNT